MVDAVRVLDPGFRVTNTSGNPQSGAKIIVYDAGTLNLRTVYSDLGLSTSLGSTVTCNSAGAPAASAGAGAEVLIYTGTTAYKVVITTSADVTLHEFDNILGALDTSTFANNTATPVTAVIPKTANYTTVAGDLGKVVNCDPTGGSFAISLLDVATAGDGARQTIRHQGTANIVTVDPNSTETVNNELTLTLSGFGESVTLVCDGVEWHVVSHVPTLFVSGLLPYITITDKDLATPPGSPIAGARYIAAASPTGGWSTFSQHDILEADGLAGWIDYTPVAGWKAWVADEGKSYVFDGTGWFEERQSDRASISGVEISNNSGDIAHDIDVTVGRCRSGDNTYDIIIPSALTKQLDAVFAAGNAAGMLDTGAIANSTWYHLFSILNPTTLATDILASTSLASPTLPSGYTKSRYIGSVLTDGSANILAFTQVGDWFYWDVPTNDFDAAVTGGAAETAITTKTPLGVRVIAGIAAFGNGNMSSWFRPTDLTDTATDVTTPLVSMQDIGNDSTHTIQVLTDTSSQINVRANTNSTNMIISTHYYIDARGKND